MPLLFPEERPVAEWREGARGPIDEFLHCSSADAITYADKMAKLDGLLVGPSAGACVRLSMPCGVEHVCPHVLVGLWVGGWVNGSLECGSLWFVSITEFATRYWKQFPS